MAEGQNRDARQTEAATMKDPASLAMLLQQEQQSQAQYNASNGPGWLADLVMAGVGLAFAPALGIETGLGGAAAAAPTAAPLAGAGGGLYDTGGLLASADAPIGAGVSDVGFIGSSAAPGGLGIDLSALDLAPTVAPVTVGASSILPSAQISAFLQNQGAPAWLANAGGGAVQGSLTTAAAGGDPLKGALGGGLGGGIGTVVGDSGVGSTIGKAVGGGTLGNIASGATSGAITSGLTTGLMGGDAGTGALMGAAGGAGGAAGSSIAKGVGLDSGLGSAVGSGLAKGAITPSGSTMATPTGSTLPSSIIGQPLSAGTGLTPTTAPALPTGTSDPAAALAATTAAGAAGSSGTNWGDVVSNVLFGQPGTGALAGIGPYAAAGAIGMKQSGDANSANQKLVQPLSTAGQYMTNASQTLLNNAMGGKIDPATGKVVSTSNAYGQSLIDASSPLNTIAQQAFADYSAGKLPAADQMALDNNVKAQKQQIASQMAAQGITDSSMIQAQMQQIDNQAMITKQQLLDARFQTGSQAFSQYLTGTQAGQQTVLQGQQYAVTQLNTMMQQAFGAGALGGSDLAQSIDMAMQSNTALGQQVGQLMQNLMMSYAIASAQGAKTGATGGTAGGALGKAVSGGVNGLISGVGKLFGSGGSSSSSGINGFGTVDPFGAGSGYTAPDYSSSMPTASDFQTVDPVQIDVPPVTTGP